MHRLIAAAIIALAAAAAVLLAAERASATPGPAPQGARTISRNWVQATACDASGHVTTTFVIPDADEFGYRTGAASQVWIDLSVFNNGFAPGTFIGAGPIAPSAAGPITHAWPGMVPGVVHYYRINALTAAGWRTLGGGTIELPDCARILRYDCSATDDTVTVLFRVPPAPGATQQWLDLALTHFLIRPPTPFIAAGPFPSEGAAFSWSGIVSWRQHYYRINARYPNGAWAVQAQGTFRTINCLNLPQAVAL